MTPVRCHLAGYLGKGRCRFSFETVRVERVWSIYRQHVSYTHRLKIPVAALMQRDSRKQRIKSSRLKSVRQAYRRR